MKNLADIKLSRRAVLAIATLAGMLFITAGALAVSSIDISNPRNGSPMPPPRGAITLVEFGDFQCGHCARFALQAMPAINREYIQTGKITFRYRHYPFLSPVSTKAAEAAECARDQGKFYAYHNRVFELTAQRETIDQEELEGAARDTGLNMDQFQGCVERREHKMRVEQDKEYGQSLGVLGTPSLFLNGQQVRWRNYLDLREQIDRLIANRVPGN